MSRNNRGKESAPAWVEIGHGRWKRGDSRAIFSQVDQEEGRLGDVDYDSDSGQDGPPLRLGDLSVDSEEEGEEKVYSQIDDLLASKVVGLMILGKMVLHYV